MRKIFLIVPVFLLVLYACSEESSEIADLSVKYDIPAEVLKSDEFNEFMQITKIGMIESAKVEDEFFVQTSNNLQKQKLLDEILQKSSKRNLTVEQASALYKEKFGVTPFSTKYNSEVEKKRDDFFTRFPEFKDNPENLQKIEGYFLNEVLDYNNFMSVREEKVTNQLKNK